MINKNLRTLSLILIGFFFSVLCFSGLVKAQDIKEGDLVRTKDNPALYLIMNGQKRVFPHLSVYLSWGLPRDFSTVKIVSDLSNYTEGEPIPFRDGSLFRGTTTSLYGKTAAAVFYVENGKLRPIKSSDVYQSLFKDPQWKKVIWIPDDLLDKFAYPMGEMIERTDIHPDGTLVKYKGEAGIYLIENGKKRPIPSLDTFYDNRLAMENVIEIEPNEIYETGEKVISGEEKLILNIPVEPVLHFANTTFAKSYRLLVFTRIKSAWQTKDGGYIISGMTDPNIVFVPPDGFVAKLNSSADIEWLKFLKTKNWPGNTPLSPTGDEDVQSIIELKNGGYLMVSKVGGFITEKEIMTADLELDKIMFTKLDKNGNMLWNKSFTAFVEDARNSLIETDDNGFLFYAPVVDPSPDNRGEDPDVYQDLPYASLKVFKFDKDGNLEWAKNIKNFISRKNDSYLIKSTNGGYAMVGNVWVKDIPQPVDFSFGISSSYPAIVKFDENFNLEWAKSLESIPLSLSMPIKKSDDSFELQPIEGHMKATNVEGLIQTKDNGYLVLGSRVLGDSLVSDSSSIQSQDWPYGPEIYLGLKFDAFGNLEWVKKITMSVNDWSYWATDFSLISTNDNNLIMAGPITWADEGYREKIKIIEDLKKSYTDKYGEVEELKDEKDKTQESREDWKKIQEAVKEMNDLSRHGIFMMKMDENLNIIWDKVAMPHRGVINYVLKATSDNGAIIGGEYETNVTQSIISNSITYYIDGLLIKIDASGNVKNNNGWLIDYNGKIITEIMTPYVISNDLNLQIDPYQIVLTNRQPEFSPYKQYKITTLASLSSSKSTPYPVTPKVEIYNSPLQNTTSVSSGKRNSIEINFERAIPVEPINDKSRVIHNELLPILEQLFANEFYNPPVKMTDNMAGTMLEYVFPRQVTAEDKIAVKNYLEELGYKTQDETNYQLTMYKPGYFLTLTFSINNVNKGFLEVTY